MAKGTKLIAVTAIVRGGKDKPTETIQPGESFVETDEKEAAWLVENGAAKPEGDEDPAPAPEAPAPAQEGAPA